MNVMGLTLPRGPNSSFWSYIDILCRIKESNFSYCHVEATLSTRLIIRQTGLLVIGFLFYVVIFLSIALNNTNHFWFPLPDPYFRSVKANLRSVWVSACVLGRFTLLVSVPMILILQPRAASTPHCFVQIRISSSNI